LRIEVDRRNDFHTATDPTAGQDHRIGPLRIAHLPQCLTHIGGAVVLYFHERTSIRWATGNWLLAAGKRRNRVDRLSLTRAEKQREAATAVRTEYMSKVM
jgi:hypothetical protein